MRKLGFCAVIPWIWTASMTGLLMGCGASHSMPVDASVDAESFDATTDVAISSMSIVVDIDDRATDQLLRTLDKQVRVLSAREVSKEAS